MHRVDGQAHLVERALHCVGHVGGDAAAGAQQAAQADQVRPDTVVQLAQQALPLLGHRLAPLALEQGAVRRFELALAFIERGVEQPHLLLARPDLRTP